MKNWNKTFLGRLTRRGFLGRWRSRIISDKTSLFSLHFPLASSLQCYYIFAIARAALKCLVRMCDQQQFSRVNFVYLDWIITLSRQPCVVIFALPLNRHWQIQHLLEKALEWFQTFENSLPVYSIVQNALAPYCLLPSTKWTCHTCLK